MRIYLMCAIFYQLALINSNDANDVYKYKYKCASSQAFKRHHMISNLSHIREYPFYIFISIMKMEFYLDFSQKYISFDSSK